MAKIALSLEAAEVVIELILFGVNVCSIVDKRNAFIYLIGKIVFGLIFINIIKILVLLIT